MNAPLARKAVQEMAATRTPVTASRQSGLAVETFLSHGTRSPHDFGGSVNPPVCRASTLVFDDMADMDRRQQALARDEPGVLWYGRLGTATTFALQDSIAYLEGGYRTLLASSGLGACIAGLSAFLKAGDHVLMSDSAYGPVRHYAKTVLGRYGITTTFYDPQIGAGIEALIQANTRVVYVESPGSQTFEVQDIPAIADCAHHHGARVVMDNTWASPLYFKALEHGVDVSVQACTKYITGHSDVLLGAITTTRECWQEVHEQAFAHGLNAGPDDAYLAQRGLRTLSVRLERHQRSALQVAEWLAAQPEVEQVLHPGLPGAPGHTLWKRDFKGSSGLFGVVFKPCTQESLRAFVDALQLFHLGFSWGGFESMVMPEVPMPEREASPWPYQGSLVRLHVGLESPDDLIADLREAMQHLRA
ncbi:MAG TPA: cystathionine beta-lyase [Castellaniella sp.]|uniref:cystathionine beta-lyase n=1 Tax=Castellaniella sp. TaxID=1955812 RepID=UPI002F13DB62